MIGEDDDSFSASAISDEVVSAMRIVLKSIQRSAMTNTLNIRNGTYSQNECNEFTVRLIQIAIMEW